MKYSGKINYCINSFTVWYLLVHAEHCFHSILSFRSVFRANRHYCTSKNTMVKSTRWYTFLDQVVFSMKSVGFSGSFSCFCTLMIVNPVTLAEQSSIGKLEML